jgi:hypothetical protein
MLNALLVELSNSDRFTYVHGDKVKIRKFISNVNYKSPYQILKQRMHYNFFTIKINLLYTAITDLPPFLTPQSHEKSTLLRGTAIYHFSTFFSLALVYPGLL